MKFLVDAQLPLSLSDFLKWKGYDSVHSSELPLKNLTTYQSMILLFERGKPHSTHER